MQLFFRKFQLIHLNTLVATDINVQIRSFFWSVFSRIRTEYGKIRTRKNSVFGHFSRSATDRNVSSILDSSYFMRFWIKEFKKLKSIFLGYIGMLGG